MPGVQFAVQQVVQFESVVEDNLIRIPARYAGQMTRVAVTLVDIGKSPLVSKMPEDLPGIDEFPAILDTAGWKFDREEANERR